MTSRERCSCARWPRDRGCVDASCGANVGLDSVDCETLVQHDSGDRREKSRMLLAKVSATRVIEARRQRAQPATQPRAHRLASAGDDARLAAMQARRRSARAMNSTGWVRETCAGASHCSVRPRAGKKDRRQTSRQRYPRNPPSFVLLDLAGGCLNPTSEA
jgi:hypothetical protein